MRLMIYGTGNVFNRYKNQVDWSSVIAILDSNETKQGCMIHGLAVQSPTSILNYEYDYVVIFSDDYFQEIKEKLLGEWKIELSKIVSYAFFLEHYQLWSEQAMQITMKLIRESEGAILDTDVIGYSRYRKSLKNEKCIVNYMDYKFLYQKDFYDDVAQSYSTVMLWGNFSTNIEEKKIEEMNPNTVVWTVPYDYLKDKKYKNQFDFLKKKYEYCEYRFLNEIVFIYQKEQEAESLNCKIYQVCHKEYSCIRNNEYQTIRVGNTVFDSDYVDDSGENIAYLNDRINECTAIFWIWKNVRTDYVGINHYRRIFFNDRVKDRTNALSKQKISRILDNENIMIVPELTRLDYSILENICMSVGEEALCYYALSKARYYIKTRHPDYLESFESVLSGNVIYRCNMMVAPWKIFDAYCSWLFSFLIDLAEEVEVSGYSRQKKRVIGYFAEIMLTVWLNNQSIKTYELPISDV